MKINNLSTSTKIVVSWDPVEVPVDELPGGQILSYKLFVDDGLYGDYQLVSHTSVSLT